MRVEMQSDILMMAFFEDSDSKELMQRMFTQSR